MQPVSDPSVPGPLERTTAVAILEQADELMASSEFAGAAVAYRRVIGFPDAEVTAAALLGLGTALYRLDRDADALSAWEQVVQVGETASTYPAWRQIAAARVRAEDLRGALTAYREADRRAPESDRAEIASRLGWLSKELGDAGSARRYFARSRGTAGAPIATYSVIAITVVVSFVCFQPDGADLLAALALVKEQVAAGEYYRLLSVTLVHASILHLLMNMYFLYFVGTLVEQMYGWRWFLAFYALGGIAASIASYLVFPDAPAVGASGAIFALCGVLFAAGRLHHPMLDRRGRAMTAQIGGLIVINLILGFGLAGIGVPIDNAAHVGGLLAGLWMGAIVVPSRVQTLSRLWQRPAGGRDRTSFALVATLAGMAGLIVVMVVGLLVATDLRPDRADAAPTTAALADHPAEHAVGAP